MNSSIDSTKMRCTREKIRNAFLDLYAEKPLSEINIKALTEAAGINRGTFYLHYLGLDDLVTSIKSEQLEALEHLTKNFDGFHFSMDDNNDLTSFFIPVLKHIASNGKLFKILLSPHSRPNFRELLKIKMRSNLEQRFNSELLRVKGRELLQKEYINMTSGTSFPFDADQQEFILRRYRKNMKKYKTLDEAAARFAAFFELNRTEGLLVKYQRVR